MSTKKEKDDTCTENHTTKIGSILIVNRLKSYENSANYCKKHSATLASLKSTKDRKRLAKLLQPCGKSYWRIGLRFNGSSQGVWANGDVYNEAESSPRLVEIEPAACHDVAFYKADSERLAKFDCSREMYFLCEKAGHRTSPTGISPNSTSTGLTSDSYLAVIGATIPIAVLLLVLLAYCFLKGDTKDTVVENHTSHTDDVAALELQNTGVHTAEYAEVSNNHGYATIPTYVTEGIYATIDEGIVEADNFEELDEDGGVNRPVYAQIDKSKKKKKVTDVYAVVDKSRETC